MSDPVIFWYRHDLRTHDLPGLQAAAKAGAVIPVFIFDESLGGDWSLGGASKWWLHHSLQALTQGLKALGGELIIRQGETVAVLEALLAETGARRIFASRQYQPWSEGLERAVREMADKAGASFKRYPGTLLFEPGSVTTGAGTPFKVFTPFWRACLRGPDPDLTIAIEQVEFHSHKPHSTALDALALLPSSPNWAAGWGALWQPGEHHAQTALAQFLNNRVQHYSEGRDTPGQTNTSRLSPYLKFGEISPRQVWWATQHHRQAHPEKSGAIDKFLSEIGWREFCNHLLALFPRHSV